MTHGTRDTNPKSVSRRFFEELWNERRLELADEVVAADCVTHQLKSAEGPTPSAPRGSEALREHIRGWLAAFPDLTWEIQASVADGERVATLAVARGTHKGDWQGVPATGRRVVIQCAVVHRVRNGRIVEDWVVTEGLGVFQQLGLIPPTEALIRRGERTE